MLSGRPRFIMMKPARRPEVHDLDLEGRHGLPGTKASRYRGLPFQRIGESAFYGETKKKHYRLLRPMRSWEFGTGFRGLSWVGRARDRYRSTQNFQTFPTGSVLTRSGSERARKSGRTVRSSESAEPKMAII